MNRLLLLLSLLAGMTVPASAMTEADIAPSALAGKTLVFTIVNGGAPYATTGTWSGTFAASGNGFTAAKITGDFVNVSTTYTATSNGTFTDVSLAKLVEGQAPATLTLYVQNGTGHYEAHITGVFGVSLNGTFAFGSPVGKTPEIAVFQPGGKKLTDGKSRVSFGKRAVGKPGAAKKFVIRNTGTAALTKIAVKKTGANKKDFTVTGPAAKALAPGKSTTFRVVFEPKAAGNRTASLRISSNGKKANPFDVKLDGKGVR